MAILQSFATLGLVCISVILFISLIPTSPDANPQELRGLSETIPLVGALNPANALNLIEKKFEGLVQGSESFAAYKGKIYSGLLDGRIVAYDGNEIVNVSIPEENCSGPWDQKKCGRPLGIRISTDGKAYYVDAYRGLIRLDLNSGSQEVLLKYGTEVEGQPIRFLNDLALDEEKGCIYFTDSSSKWDLIHIIFQLLETSQRSRLLHYDLNSKSTKVLADGFYFANGVQLTHDKKALLVSDTLTSKILKYELEGPKKGKVSVFIDGLPGFSDNIRLSRRGGYWVALPIIKMPGSVDFITDIFVNLPYFIRKGSIRVMIHIGTAVNWLSENFITSKKWKALAYMTSSYKFIDYYMLPNYGMIIELDNDGNIVASFHSKNGEIRFISEVFEKENGKLYLGSYQNNFLGVSKIH